MSEIHMTAADAKAKAEKNLKGPIIEPVLTFVFGKIQEQVDNGKFSLVHPFEGLKPYPSSDVQEAVYGNLRRLGFVVTNHPDPDPGHPASRPYDSISWE